MSEPLPRALVHRGHVDAGGLWIDRRLLGELEARRRVLELLGHVRTVLDTGDGYLVQLSRPQRLDADRCVGAPLVEHDGRWLAVPLRPCERERLDAPRGSVVRARGGRLVVEPLARAEPVDVAGWLDASGWSVLPVESLGARPVVAEPRLDPEGLRAADVRTVLGDRLPSLDPDRAEIMRALDRRGAGAELPARESLRDRLARWLGRFTAPPRRALPAAAGSVAHTSSPAAPPRVGWLRRWLTTWVARSRLGALIGERQARYLEHTLRLFQTRKWDEALRHAIPFSSLPGVPAPPTITVPSPRTELELQATPSRGAASSMTLSEELYAQFAQHYRKAAQVLEDEGRIEEAAYVLFELLGMAEEGVAMLERHRRYALAARLAEGRGLAPGLVIRLWCLAGDHARAVLVARRTGAFADAVQRLERAEPAIARQLRLVWADCLATAGDYAAAVDVVWPVTEGRALARAWVDHAIDFGGPVACRMLVRKLVGWSDEPRALAEVRLAVDALLDDPTEDAVPLRQELARAWIATKAPGVPAWVELGRALARRTMLDTGEATSLGTPRQLLELVGDPVLLMDAKGASAPRSSRAHPLRSHIFEACERGTTPVDDAVLLPNGRLLLALGDAGMRLLDAHGRTLRAWEHPASRLVLSDSGSRALALIERGDTWSMRRLDLVTGRAEPWCDARLRLFASTYGGEGWFVVTDGRLALVDVQAPGLDVPWSVEGPGKHIMALDRSPTHTSIVGAQVFPDRRRITTGPLDVRGLTFEVWTHQLTHEGPKLRRRHHVDVEFEDPPPELVDPTAPPMSLTADIEPMACSVNANGVLAMGLPCGDAKRPMRVVTSGPGDVVAKAWFDVGVRYWARALHVDVLQPSAEGVLLRRLDYASTAPAAPTLELRGSRYVHLHPLPRGPAAPVGEQQPGSKTLVVDDLGRVILLDPDGRIERHWLV